MRPKPRILVVDGDEGMRSFLHEALGAEGHAVAAARDAGDALALLRRERFDLVIAEIFLSGLSGIELLKRIRGDPGPAPAILMTRDAPMRTIVAGMRAGALDCLEKPIDPERLKIAVEHALGHARLERENAALKRQEKQGELDMVFASEAMRDVVKMIDLTAPTDLTILVEGESGVGKELVARRIHRMSPRAATTLVAFNCGAVQAGLLETELFGHEKGAFTGAVAERQGLFEVADGGTLFLDEIGETSLDLQVKLLRVLETGEFRRVGGQRVIRADTRIIAATNKRLADEVKKGAFREDLFYRLNVIRIEVPALRRRREDVGPLVEAFVDRARRRGMRVRRFSEEALDALRAHAWPGNVRELENLVERALILARHDDIGALDIRDLMRPGEQKGEPVASDDSEVTLAEMERRMIIRALGRHGGNKVRTARRLGINVKTLYNKIKAYEIDAAALTPATSKRA